MIIALIVAAGIWLWATDRQRSREAAIADSPLHQAIRKARPANMDAAIEEVLPQSFDEAVAVLAGTAKIKQPFARPIRTYGNLDIAPTKHGVDDYRSIARLQHVLKWTLKIERSTVRAGACAELWFPNRFLFAEPTRLAVYLFEMNDGSVGAHAKRRGGMCWDG